MNLIYITGPANTGKSTLIKQQYDRLIKTGNYTVVDFENPTALSDFRFLLQHTTTKECIILNSPTDEHACIKAMENFIEKQLNGGYNIVKVVTSIRDYNINPVLHTQTKRVLEKLFPNATEVSVNLMQMTSSTVESMLNSLV